jgi:hypothetical protein
MKAGPIAGTLCALTLLGAPPASAAISATAAPIGSASSGSYLVTVVNEGPKTEGVILIELAGSETATGIVPGACVYGQPVAGSVIGCPQIEAGATLQVCYNGPQTEKVEEFSAGAPAIPLSTVGPVASCPLAGFVPKSTGEGEGNTGTGGGDSGGGSGSGSVTKFSLGKVKKRPAKGTATLAVKVPGPGTIKLTGKKVRRATVRAKKAGTFNLTVEAKGKVASKLATGGKVTVKVVITFTPTDGKPKTKSETVRLVHHKR